MPGLSTRRRRAVTTASLSAALLVPALAVALATGFGPSIGRGDQSGRLSSSAAAIPAAARAEVSAALGAAQPAFHVHATARGVLTASNAAQGISARFAPGGVTVSKAALDLRLSMRSVGFGDATHGVAAPAAAPAAYSNRATYARGVLSEWYANGPAGLEQGFTLLHAPAQAGSTAAPLTLDLALAANARPRLAANGQSLTLERGDAQLRYGNLLTTDASGRALHTWLELRGARLLIRVDAAGARYPLRIDPLVQAGSKLTGTDELGEGLLGTSVALSADGSTLLVGAPHDENANHGAAFVFVKEGSSWVSQSPKLTGAEPPSGSGEEEQCAEESSEEAGECAFGTSVALSADGNTALVGEPSATAMPGSAWIFTRSGTTWTRSAVLKGTGASGEGRFGRSVALSGDGATALVGDPSASSQHGKAWVFTHGGSGWTVSATLPGSEPDRLAHFGRGVALSGDGETALIGAPGESGYAGAAWTFTNGGSGWVTLGGKLTGAGENGEARFGKSVALSGDGATALIGGLNDSEGAGAAWPFARSASGFAQQGKKLTAEGQPHFGFSVALSGDGTFGLVGSPRAETNGLVTVLTRTGSSWSSAGEKLAGSGGEGKGWSGAAVAVSQDGTVVAVGAPHDSVRKGAAWIFTGSPEVPLPPPVVTSVMPGAGEAGSTVKVKGENFTGADAVFFGSKQATFTVSSALMIEAVAPEGLTGTVNVRVRTPSGTSPVSRPADEFRYTTGKAKGGGTENPDPGNGGGSGTGEGTPGSQTTTGGGAKIASGGVLGTTTSSSGVACVLSLRSKYLAVTGSRTVALRLQRTGAGACSGKLTLSFNRAKRGKRPKLQTIGTASFAMGSASSKVLKIDLNKAGRKLFSSHGRRLNASLSFVRALPAPTLARSASVRLTWKKTKKVTLGR
ncbi:MAG TPA: IPT/TIG domain-containing protein [Solirubrobacteraceae bacterium]